jgi:hypothetical protein
LKNKGGEIIPIKIYKPGVQPKKPEEEIQQPHEITETNTNILNNDLKIQNSSASSPIDNLMKIIPENLVSLLDITKTDDYFIIKLKKFLGPENFSKLANCLRAVNGEFVSSGSGQESYFRVPITAISEIKTKESKPEEIQISQDFTERNIIEKSGEVLITKEKERPPETEEEFEEFERRDEEQIKAEILGRFLTEYVYSFTSGGQVITGLSWAGVKEAARRLGYIKIEDLKIIDMGDYWIALCKVKDIVNKLELYGAAQQNKKMKLKDGTEKIDDFSIPKVVSKAQRNAIRSVIPEHIIKEMIVKLREEAVQRSKITKM